VACSLGSTSALRGAILAIRYNGDDGRKAGNVAR
jgi:hypothetical protein